MSSKECGVLLPIFSLPGKYGIGTLGQNAYKFIDFLSECGFSYWEVLPVEDIGKGNSPFDIPSAFSLNYLFIDFDLLVEDGILNSRDFTGIEFSDSPRKVNYNKIKIAKDKILRTAFKRFDKTDPDFLSFKENNSFRYNYALFETIKSFNNNKNWFDFRLEDRYYASEIKKEYETFHHDTIDYYLFLAYIFKKQWKRMHDYAKSKGIDIIGEIPHFLSYNSDAMYMTPELFLIDKRNIPTFVVGFPPDDFRKEGQKRGYPLYDWEYMKTTNYKRWRYRLDAAYSLFDRIKVNHFMGFYKTYAVPFRSKNGKKGKYFKGPGLDFINDVKENYPLIANNTGIYPEDTQHFINESKLETLKLIGPNFFQDKFFTENYLPSNISEDTYLYLESHDYMPLKGLLSSLTEEQKILAENRVKSEARKLKVENEESISLFEKARYLMKLALASRANHVTFTMQDILFQGKESRINEPGTVNEENWTYRFLWSDLSDGIVDEMKKMLIRFKRNK